MPVHSQGWIIYQTENISVVLTVFVFDHKNTAMYWNVLKGFQMFLNVLNCQEEIVEGSKMLSNVVSFFIF